MSNSTKQVGVEDFNPKNLPCSKIGKCENIDHESWTGEEPTDETLQLVMLYTDQYCWWIDQDKSSFDDDELDNLYEKYEKNQWLVDSEQYFCESCAEELRDQ